MSTPYNYKDHAIYRKGQEFPVMIVDVARCHLLYDPSVLENRTPNVYESSLLLYLKKHKKEIYIIPKKRIKDE